MFEKVNHTFLTLFLRMDSTANTCSPIADSSISDRRLNQSGVFPATNYTPALTGNDSALWGFLLLSTLPHSRRLSLTVRGPFIQSDFLLLDVSALPVTLQNLRHICTLLCAAPLLTARSRLHPGARYRCLTIDTSHSQCKNNRIITSRKRWNFFEIYGQQMMTQTRHTQGGACT